MTKISFIVSSQTIPYVEMKLSNKNRVMIPVGRMLNMMEEMLGKKVKVITVDAIDVFSVYDSFNQQMFVEQRSDNCIENIVARFDVRYDLKRYIELYTSIIDLIRYTNLYYNDFKVFAITLNKAIDISAQTVIDGSTEIYIAKSVNHVYNQFNEVHPYLLDNTNQCNIRRLTKEEIKEICDKKIKLFVDLLYENTK